jgi:hypothetical protein
MASMSDRATEAIHSLCRSPLPDRRLEMLLTLRPQVPNDAADLGDEDGIFGGIERTER